MVERRPVPQDLYYRLRVVEIEIPPLRERGDDDIAELAEHFVGQFARRYRKGPMPARRRRPQPALVAHPWPGNVRELEHSIERAVVLAQGATIGVKDLQLEPRRTTATMSAVSAATR